MNTLTSWNSTFLIDASTTSDPSDIQIQALVDGGFVTVWSAASDEGDKVLMMVFNADGTPRTGEIEIVRAESDGRKYMPVVTALSNGNFIVTWEDGSELDGETDGGIWGQIFSPDGVKISADIHINGILPYVQSETAITALANGGFAVAYLDYPLGSPTDTDSSDIITRVFNAAGEPVSGDIQVNTTASRAQTDPAIITLNNGGYAVFFVDDSRSENFIRGRYFTADGTPLESDFIVSDTVGGQNNPAATTLADGKFVVVWETNSYDIHALIFNADGTPLGSEFVVNQAVTSGIQQDPAIVALKDGGFAIAYTSFGAELGSHVAMFKSSGEFVSDVLIEPVPGSEFAEGTETKIAALADGRLVVSWVATHTEEANRDYYAQIFDPRTGAITIQGTVTNDHFVGTAFNDVLDGGAGVDVLRGGAGDDTYYVDDAGDTVVETSSADGFDTVVTSVSYALPGFVERLVASSSSSINLTGNGLDNVIIGNAGANMIDGGAGADMMQGGAGDDTYHIDNAGDAVSDESGSDTVLTSISYTLGADVENLFATGAASLVLTGNAFNNVIVGNAGSGTLRGENGNDTLLGGSDQDRLHGGLGNDVLDGGAGRDIFVFDTKLGTYKTDRQVNFDTLTGFSAADDTIQLENAIFKKLKKTGTLKKDFFTVGTKAKDKNDYLVYDKKKGVLSYDADGSGKGKAIEFAQFKKNLKLTEKDFFII